MPSKKTPTVRKVDNSNETVDGRNPSPLDMVNVGSHYSGVIKWDPFWGNQTMQMYGKFEGFPLNSALLGLVI